MPYIYLNGDILPGEKAMISVADRSYQFGEGAFETFRTWNGRTVFLDRHLARLEWTATALGMPFPENFDLAQITADLLQRNQFKEARFKVILSRTQVHPEEEQSTSGLNVLVLAENFDPAVQPQVYRLKTTRNIFNDSLPLAALKTTNYLVKIYARAQAKDQGYDDAILLNGAGRVTEATTGNLFWVDQQGRLFTVLDEEGFLGGIMRKIFIDMMQEKKLALGMRAVTPEELSSAREVFLTNAIVGVMPVVAVDLRLMSGGEAGALTLSMRDALLNHIKNTQQRESEPENE